MWIRAQADLKGESNLFRSIGFVGDETGNRHAEQPDRLLHRKEGPQQFGRYRFQLAAAADGTGNCSAPRDQFKVSELHFECNCPTLLALLVAVPPDLVYQRLQFGDHRFKLGKVAGESVLGADRLSYSIHADFAIIDASRYPIVVSARLAEIGLHEFERLIAHVEAGVETKGVHLGAGRRPDAVKFADRKRLDERRPHLRRDDVLSVWLAVIGGKLRQKLVVGDAGRSIEAGYLLDLCTNRERHVPRQRNALQIFGHVEVGLIQRQRLDGNCPGEC